MSDSDAPGKHKKVYARGYFDGLRAAGVTPDEFTTFNRAYMTESKFNSIYSGLTSIAKKIYDAVPMQRPWSASQIYSELLRNGCSTSMKTAAGCLCSLAEQGLIQEPKKGEFIRVMVKKKIENNVVPIEEKTGLKALGLMIQNAEKTPKEEPMQTESTQKPKDAIDILSSISARAVKISAELRNLANDIDNAALEITRQMSSDDDEVNKLRQLKQLLKGLG